MTLVPGVSALPENSTFRRACSRGKAWGDLKPEGDQLVITVSPEYHQLHFWETAWQLLNLWLQN